MPKRATSKRARSLKRESGSKAPAQAKRLSRGRTFKEPAKAKTSAAKIRDRVTKAVRAAELAKKKKAEENAKQVAKVRRYYEIRDSNVVVLRGPLQVESSWVDKIAYVRYGRRNGVAVQFHDKQGNPTVQCFYPNTELRDYDYLRKAASKGKAIWRRFYDLPYEIMN